MADTPAPAAGRHGAGFRARLRATTLLIALAFLAFAVIRAAERRQAEQRRLGDRAQEQARIAARSLDATITQSRTLLHSVALNVDFAAKPDANDAVLARLFASIPSTFGNLVVLDSTGRNIGAARIPAIGRTALDLSDRPYIAEARRSGRFTVGMSVRSRSAAGAPWIIPMVLPVVGDPRTREGAEPAPHTVRGFVVASVRIDSLEAVELVRPLPKGSVLTVMDSAGVVVLRTIDGDRWIAQPFPGFPQQRSQLQTLGVDTIVPSPVDHIDRLFGTEALRTVPWRLFVGIPVQEVFAPSRDAFVGDLLLGLMVSLVIALLGWWLTARLVAPIERLTQDAQAISDGDMSRRSAITGNNEVGVLARTFNGMADAVVQRGEQLAASQRQLQQAQKLEALGAFAGGIAHDFNNYLSTIQGHAELALDQLAPDAPAHAEVTSVLTAAQRASELTRQILSFSSRRVVAPSPVNVNATIGSMERLLVRLLGESVGFTRELDASIGAVHMDPGQFEQVLMNLALNARDAMQGRGMFTVRTQRVVDEDGTEWVQVTADDSGPGVPPDARPRIFEPFFTTKDRGHGTGLGLSISYGLITGAGGTITVGEAPGQGARFVVRLPAQVRAEASESAPAAGVRPSGGAERILLVDDDDGVGTVAERVLVRAGYTVVRANHAVRALEMMAEARFALVITDVVMPGMSGPQMAREAVRRHGPLRLLFISGFPDDDLLMEALRVHQAAFLPKPLSRDALLQAVRDLLDAPTGAAAPP